MVLAISDEELQNLISSLQHGGGSCAVIKPSRSPQLIKAGMAKVLDQLTTTCGYFIHDNINNRTSLKSSRATRQD
jgi:hypothetical protein